jgi:hypothetical protein
MLFNNAGIGGGGSLAQFFACLAAGADWHPGR